MTSLTENLVNRVSKLPKPSNSAEALQPLFECVSNAIHATESRFGDAASTEGKIAVEIRSPGAENETMIVVSDNGVGLNDECFKAFCEMDTSFKKDQGGKGVGRLLWLDAFKEIHVESVFQNDEEFRKRSFEFRLSKSEQISSSEHSLSQEVDEPGSHIRFSGLRGSAYISKFPKQPAVILKHFGSHFFSDFIMGNTPAISFDIDGKKEMFPDFVKKMQVDNRGCSEVSTDEFGVLKLHSFICANAASAGFNSYHQLHFVANGRTVMTRTIDGLLGLGKFGDQEDFVYHGCVSGPFLDDRVNQERTQFNFQEDVLIEISKLCAEKIRKFVIKNEIEVFDKKRLADLSNFLEYYPSFKFQNEEALLQKMPRNAGKDEDFGKALIATKIRRDRSRRKDVDDVISTLDSKGELANGISDKIVSLAEMVQEEEQRQLAEYVIRRKVVLDILDKLISRVLEKPNGKDVYHLEKTLHQIICPMRVRGDDPSKVDTSAHDLWIINENLTFTHRFASDVPISQIVSDSQNLDRPDIFLFDQIIGFGIKDQDPLNRAILVELKRPGRVSYDEAPTLESQINKYIRSLRGRRIEGYNKKTVRIAHDCDFHCYVIADIIGELDAQLESWDTIYNGKGRWRHLGGKNNGFIEVIEWRDLIKNAQHRNKAFIEKIGLSFSSGN